MSLGFIMLDILKSHKLRFQEVIHLQSALLTFHIWKKIWFFEAL